MNECSIERCTDQIDKLPVQKVRLIKDDKEKIVLVEMKNYNNQLIGYCKDHRGMVAGHYDLREPTEVTSSLDLAGLLADGWQEVKE